MTRSALTAFRLACTLALLAYIACKGESAVEPPVPVPTTIVANSSTSLTGVAGSPVSPSPSILVKDQNGAPMAGATVNFLVLSGGGSVSSASVTTDASGIGTVGSWTLGAAAGTNALNAWADTLTAITFTATGTAGAAASLAKSAGDNQTATAGTPVAVAPSVTVKDANGNAKANVVVTFAVASGGGSLTGGSATSSATGVATVGSWTLGASGTNTLTASAPGLATVTFTATATPSLCGASTAYSLGTTTSGSLATTDCKLSDGTYADFFSTTIGEANAYLFRQQSAVFDTYMFLATPDESVIAENDDETSATTNSAIKALLPPGSYLIGASSYDAAITGDYSISSSTTSTDVTGCELVFVVKTVSTTQKIEAADCLWTTPPAAPIYADGFFIFLKAGQSMTVTMSSTEVDSFLELVRVDGARVASNDNKDANTKDAQLTYTAATTTYYAIFARTASTAQAGSYTLTIQ